MKHFRIQTTLRVLLIGLTLFVAIWLLTNTASYVAGGLLVVVVGIQLHGLVRYVERTNRDLSRFLRSIRFSDFSQSFTSGGRGAAFSELAEAFSEVVARFQEARAEKEEHYRYLQTVMQHVGIGLLSFRRDGQVELINNAAKRLLGVPYLKNIYALPGKDLVASLLQLRSGDKVLIKVVEGDTLLQLVLNATELKQRGELLTLVSIQDIQSELEEKEIEAWQRLTRVLTHEIMNSITPITSLASTAGEMVRDVLEEAENGRVETDEMEEVRGAIATIEKRSASLLGFVQAYRSLTRIPQPDFRILSIEELFGNVGALLQPEFDARGLTLSTDIDPPMLDLTADPDLTERVLINLVKNALEAVEGLPDGHVRLSAHLDQRGRTVIQVTDNGPGIEAEALDKIFIPFFTTKKEGSGIGLSLSRQIMRQHGGSLTAFSEPDRRTVFTMRF